MLLCRQRNFANYPLFSTSNLIETKQYQFLYPTLELAKLGRHKDYILLRFIKSKFKEICISHQDKLY